MKTTGFLALALAVLPAANAASVRTPFCYRKFTCYKAGAAPTGDNSGSNNFKAGTGGAVTPGSAAVPTTGTLGATGCKGQSGSTYLVNGVFSAKGGVDDAWTSAADGAATDAMVASACLVKFTAADGKMATLSNKLKPSTKAEAGPKTEVVALVSKTYKGPDCSKELATDYSQAIGSNKKLYGGDVPAGGVDTANEAITTGSHITAAVGDKVIVAKGTTSADKNIFTLTHATGLFPLGTTYAGIPEISASDWDGNEYDGAGAKASPLAAFGVAASAQPSATNGMCQEIASAFKSEINGDINLSDSGARRVPYALKTEYVASGKHETVYKAAAKASSPAPDRAPGAVSAHCNSDGDLTIKYHAGADCSAAATGSSHWQATNASAGLLTCIPTTYRHADCTGTDACLDAVDTMLAHLTAESGADKACTAAATDKNNKACSKACICGKTKADKAAAAQLNWAFATTDAKTDSTCWLSADAPGQYNVSLSTPVSVSNGVTSYATPSGANGIYATTIGHLFANDAGFNKNIPTAATSTAGVYGCGRLDIAEKTTAGTDGYSADHDGLWTKTGCGYTAGGSGGAQSNIVLSGLTVVTALIGAALL